MTDRAPGSRIRAMLSWCVDEAFLSSAIDPTISDFHFELTCAAANSWRRYRARALFWLALARLLACSPRGWRLGMGRLVAVMLTGGVGAAAILWARSAEATGGIGLMPFVGTALAAPVVFRVFRLGSTYRAMFANCLGVSGVLSLALIASFGNEFVARLEVVPVWVAARALIVFALTLLFASALCASLALKVNRDGGPSVHRAMLALIAGLLMFALVIAPLKVVTATGIPGVLASIGGAFYWGFIFTCVAAVGAMPILLIGQLWLRSRWSIVLLGLVLAPLLMMTVSGSSRTLGSLSLVPFVVAMSTIAWVLGSRGVPRSTEGAA